MRVPSTRRTTCHRTARPRTITGAVNGLQSVAGAVVTSWTCGAAYGPRLVRFDPAVASTHECSGTGVKEGRLGLAQLSLLVTPPVQTLWRLLCLAGCPSYSTQLGL